MIYRVTGKETRETFYLVKSDSAPNTYYQVRWENAQMAWTCTCPSHRSCKHRRAVQEVIKARRQRKDEERSRFNYYELSIGA